MSVLGWTVVASVWAVSVLAAYGYGYDHGGAAARRSGGVRPRLSLIRSEPRPMHHAGGVHTSRADGAAPVWPMYTPRRRSRSWRA